MIVGAIPMMFGGAAAPAGDPHWDNVVLAMHFDGADGSTVFTDLKGNTVTPTGNSKIQTAVSKFGGSAGYFDGTGDYLSIPSSTSLDLPGEFTIEFFAQVPSFTKNGFFLGRKLLSSNPTTGDWFIYVNATSGSLSYMGSSNSKTFTFASGNPVINTMYHIALVRSGTTVHAYKHGEKSTNSFSDTGNYSNPRTLEIARWDSVPNSSEFYMDDLRITKGVARYTDSFTPPAAPFPDF